MPTIITRGGISARGFGFAAASAVAIPTTWNPADKNSDITLSGGNLIATWANDGGKTGNHGLRSTTSRTAGKLYFEILNGSSHSPAVGLATGSYSLTFGVGANANSWGYTETGTAFQAGTIVNSGGASIGASSVVGFAVDFGTGDMWVAIANSWQFSGNPATGANPTMSFTPTKTLFVMASAITLGGTMTAKFSTSNTYSPPSGFSLWG